MAQYQDGGAEMGLNSMAGLPMHAHGQDLSGLPMDDVMQQMDLDMSSLDGAEGQNGGFSFADAQMQQPSVPPNSTMDSEMQMTGAGAGPLPTGFGAPNMNPSGSTLTEFTKRRNWSQRVLEELRDLLHILTPDGRILYVSPSCKPLTGWEPSHVMGRFINEFIHPDDIGIFVKEFNESIASGNPLRFFYRFRKTDDTWVIFESHGHPHLSTDTNAFAPPNSINCRGFFMMARPYPTKNAALLDSFLEHKIENERLMKRIAELKREEQDEQDDWTRKTEGAATSMTPSESQATQNMSQADAASYAQMPPPAKPAMSNTALTRQNLDEALAASRPDSINDKMARYEGANHLETIEMLTGLRYRDGERSQGISTGDASPNLIRGDAGIQISLDRDGRNSADKTKKKLKIADEYVCTDCGTLDSPEWRKGPNGPKTLCNACGLRWAKKEKKKQAGPTSNMPSSTGMMHTPAMPMHSSTGSS
ncbi:blue light regulator 2 [Stemphylium lycopersici]|uniref:Blue light regulator 2 n=1 Tax=Stemphylium lycopersici TaxID=183478 RepID=A0A364N5G1_STELY|nr:blue light regulator 2 [Stemphylium lycopersici]